MLISRQLITRLIYFFFFNDTATTEIYTLSLHDALPIYFNKQIKLGLDLQGGSHMILQVQVQEAVAQETRSEEHTSELQSPCNLVCRLLLEKKKKKQISISTAI